MAVPKLLFEQCNKCEKKLEEQKSLCAGCKVVHYCSKEHQLADWPTHKTRCTPVKKARALFEKEESKLRDWPGDWTCPANPLEVDEPHFWGWHETRPYMRARYGLLDAMRKIRTREAVQAACDHTMEIFRLNRSDNMGVRDMTPSLMIRLGHDQQAYDFMKWHATTGQEGDYDWGDLSLPFLNLEREDAFEPITAEGWTGNYSDLAHMVALTLLKLRLLLDLYSLQNSMKLAEQLPQELVDEVREHLTSEIVAGKETLLQNVRDGISIQPQIDMIEGQMNTLFENVKQSNKYFWPAIVNPGSSLTARPEAYSMGSREEMQLKMQYSYEAWEETPGAIEWVKKKLAQ